MYNQMPFGFPNNFNPGMYGPLPDMNNSNNYNYQFNDLEKKINDIDKRLKIVERKLNLGNNYDNQYQSSMYMM